MHNNPQMIYSLVGQEFLLLYGSPLQLRTYPNSPQKANVVSQQFLKDEEVAGCLLLMQLLHLVLQLCQLGQSPGQSCVVLRVSQHGHAFCKYRSVPT